MKWGKAANRLATVYFWGVGLLIIAILAWFLYQIMSQGLPHLSWNFITGMPQELTAGGGVGPHLFNSFYILFLSMLLSAPIGIGAGI